MMPRIVDQMERLFSVDGGMDSDGDEDVYDNTKIKASFPVPNYLQNEISVGLERTYILHLDISHGPSKKVVAGLSNTTGVVYDLETSKQLLFLRGHKKGITGVKCHTEDASLVYTSSTDGSVKLWDVRATGAYIEYTDISEKKHRLKSLSCFDVNFNNTYLAAGTELYEGDAYLLFWDVRSSKLLGGYWESHKDDLTSISFHPTKRDWLTTGSIDGLINVFDICEHDENEAFIYCLNSDSSVQKLGWFFGSDGEENVSCITHTEDLLLWNIEDGSPFCNYSRESITNVMLRKCIDYCYVTSVHETNNKGELIVVCGSSSGAKECLRLLKFEKNVLKPMSNLKGNKQIVRSSRYITENNILVAGGESGFISMWKLGEEPLESGAAQLKMKSNIANIHGHKCKPY